MEVSIKVISFKVKSKEGEFSTGVMVRYTMEYLLMEICMEKVNFTSRILKVNLRVNSNVD